MDYMIENVEKAVREFCKTQDGAHDWCHIDRVRNAALHIAAREGGDRMLIELCALVHDVGDHKIHESEEDGRVATEILLTKCQVPHALLVPILETAMNVSFKGAGVPDSMVTLEGKIVQDADRLDSIGAIAVGRTFTGVAPITGQCIFLVKNLGLPTLLRNIMKVVKQVLTIFMKNYCLLLIDSILRLRKI